MNLPLPTAHPIYPKFSFISKVGQPVDPGFTITGYLNVVTQGNYAYAMGGGNPGFSLSIFDITDSINPKVISYLTTGSVPWVSGTPYYLNGSYSMDIEGNYLYVASSGSSYLYVVDVSNPFLPKNISRLLITNTPGSIYGVSYQGGYCYIATQNTGLVVVDVGGGLGGGTLLAPVQTFQELGSVKSFGVVANGNTIYTTQYSTTSPYTIRQIKSWAINAPGTPTHPSLIQSLQVTGVGEALGISVVNNPTAVPPSSTAFVTTQATVYSVNLVDITIPSNMVNLSQIISLNKFNSAFAGQALNTILYVPSGSNTTYGGAIDVYDISTRTSPTHLKQITTNVPSSVFGNIALVNGYIYCADYGPVNTIGNLDVFTQINTGFNGVA